MNFSRRFGSLLKSSKAWMPVAGLLVLPFLLLELWLGHSLFNHVSYTNSRNMDPQIENFEARQDWEYVVIGSSEAKWGVVPARIDAALSKHNISTSGFNLGFDGFSASYYQRVLPLLDLPARLPALKVVLIGINLIESVGPLPESFDQGLACDGLLQRAVFNSAFGKDYNLYHLCNSQRWPAPLVSAVEKVSATVRYRQAVRSLLLGQNSGSEMITLASNGLTQYPDGFYAHKSIEDNAEESALDYQRFLDKRNEEPQEFEPMAPDHWPKLLAPQGFFDQWASYLDRNRILPVFFVLPTNPIMIDARNRRADYLRHSQLMQAWAAQRSRATVFVDLGIKDSYNPTTDFADYRHLSEAGAFKFSQELGEQLAENATVVAVLSSSHAGSHDAEASAKR